MTDKPARPKWNGAALKKHREARKWSVEQLAEMVGAAESLVYKWEGGQNMPKSDYLAALVIVLNAPAIRFFSGIDEFQARMKGPALIARKEVPIDIKGETDGTEFFTTDEVSVAARRAAAQVLPRESQRDEAKPTSGSRRGRRSPKRRV